MHSFKKTAKNSARVLVKCAALGAVLAGLGACVDDYSNPPPHGYYSNGYYHYYDEYPSSAYSGDYDEFNRRRNAEERNGMGHSDDRNFHNRDDWQQYDR
jgi:hypothetical protein